MSARDRIIELLRAGEHTARQIAIEAGCGIPWVWHVAASVKLKPKQAGHVARVPDEERIEPRSEDEIRADLRAQLEEICGRQHAAVTAARMVDPL